MTSADIQAALAQLSSRVTFHPRRGLLLLDAAQRWVAHGEALNALTEWLYLRHFCRTPPGAGDALRYAGRASGEPSFVAALATATHGPTYWEPGWRVSRSTPQWALVSDGSLSLFIEDRAQLRPSPGHEDEVEVRLPCARENLIPGYFTVVSRAGPVRRQAPHLLLFLNVAPHGAPPLLETLVHGEALAQECFEVELINDPAAYGRVDTAVLRVEPWSYARLVRELLGFKRTHAHWFRDGHPLCTLELSPGIAVAEAPPEAPGRQRCALVAEAVWEALRADEPFGSSWLRRVREHFAREGLSSERPHLRPRRESLTVRHPPKLRRRAGGTG